MPIFGRENVGGGWVGSVGWSRAPQAGSLMGSLGPVLGGMAGGGISTMMGNARAARTGGARQSVVDGMMRGAAGPEYQEQFKKELEAGRSADAFMKAFPEALQELQIDPDQWKTFGARDKMAAMKGFLEAQTVKNLSSQMQARQDEAAAWPAFMGKMLEGAGVPAAGQMGPVQPSFDPASMMGAMSRLPGGQAGVVARAVVPQLMRETTQEKPISWEDLKPHEFMTSTGQVGLYGKGGQFQVLAGDPEVVPVTDPMSGAVVGQVLKVGNSVRSMPREQTARPLQESFYTGRQNILEELDTMERNLQKTDEQIKAERKGQDPKQLRQAWQSMADAARKRLDGHYKLYESQGYGTPELWQQLRAEHGIKGGTGSKSAAVGKGGGSRSQAETERLLNEANEALKKGADPEAVRARLEKLGISATLR